MNNYSNDMFLVNIDALKKLINDEISNRIDQLTESNQIKIEDYEPEINELIREYISYNVTVTLDC